jgi:hypothetical protein
MNTLIVQPLHVTNITGVLELQAVHDEYLGLTVLPSYGWDEPDLRAAVARFKSTEARTHETRVHVMVDANDLSKPKSVLGCLCHEYDDSGYRILLFTAKQQVVRQALVGWVLKRAKLYNRPRVGVVVSDYDSENIRFFRGLGWTFKLLRGHLPKDVDAWEFQTVVAGTRERAETATDD